MITYAGQERRQGVRIKTSLTVTYHEHKSLDVHLRTENKKHEYKDRCASLIDLGEGGVSILADISIPAGTLIWIQFALTEDERPRVSLYGVIEVLGEVRYALSLGQHTYRIGMCFVNLDNEYRMQIDRFIEKVSGQGRV